MGKKLVIFAALLLSAIQAFWKLSSETLDNHECFVSVTTREMLQSGNWILPTFNGENRLQKTPLSYWLVAGISKVTGGVDEFSSRLPSAVFAFFSVCAIIYFVEKWLSLRTALLCAGVWATTLVYVRYAHNARPEMALAFFVTLCFLCFYSAITAQSRKRQIAYMLVFWVSFGLGNLAKGPAPIPLVMVPLFFYTAIFRQWKKLPKLLPVTGVLIFLLIVLPWPLAIAHRVNWDLVVWKQQFVDRFFGEYASGHKPLYFYLFQIFLFITPWFVFLPMALVAPFYREWGRKRQVMWFLWVCFIAEFAFLTVSGGKRQHYILPVMPVMAILIGILLEDVIFIREAFDLRQARGILTVHIVAAFLLAGGGIAYVAFMRRELLPATIVMAGALVIGAVIIGVLFARNRPAIACGGLFVWLVVSYMIVFTGFVIPLNYNRPLMIFSKEVSQIVPPTDKLVAYRSVAPGFIYYFGRPVPKILDGNELPGLYQQGCWIVAFGKGIDKLPKAGQFDLVYLKQGVDWHGDKQVAGGLFHKQAATVPDANDASPAP